MKNRFLSPTLWTALVALILFVLKNYNLLEPIGLTQDSFKELTSLLFAVFVGFGIINNPTNPNGI
jgi:uncharacterized membrane protein